MVKYKIIGVAITVSLFMAITVFAGWGFKPSSWDVSDRVFWSLLLIVITISGIVLGLIIEESLRKDS